MAKGLSLHIGLNAVDPRHYQGWSGELLACEFDAHDMKLIADRAGFESKLLLTKDGSRANVTTAIDKAATALGSGDIFFMTYSGHGGQVPDVDGDESDGEDETWCLFDSELLDDEIYHHLGKFAEGVRILVFSDSCHSGTVLRDAVLDAEARSPNPVRYRAMPGEVAARTYLANKEFYDDIGNNKKFVGSEDKVKASALLISGCQDNQLSSDGTFNGLFTRELKKVWNGGKFKGSYKQFHRKIVRGMPDRQTPKYFLVGATNKAFERQGPFTI